MASPSFPVFLDPPNWNQQQELQLSAGRGDGGGINNGAPRATPPPSFDLPRSEFGLLSSTRPGPMHWRARLAKLPRPEQALKCPRCNSTNTKFCYFNNYSLSQPRHFCKACRRYWTRGGALRNVPVGGGCRKSKRDKAGGSGSSSKFSSANPSTAAGAAGGAALASALTLPPQPPQMTSLPDCGASNSGLSFTGIQALDYEVSGGAGLTSSVGFHNLGLQQEIDQRTIFPLITLGELAVPPPPASLVPNLCMHPASLQGDGGMLAGRLFMGHRIQPNIPASAKMKAHVDDAQRLGRLPRQVSGDAGNYNDLIWGGSADDHGWETAGFFNFNSSSIDGAL